MPKYAILCSIDETRLDLFGGPARVAEGGRPETMIIIDDADDLTDAQSFIAQEPYNRNGEFSHVAVRPWSQVLPKANRDRCKQPLMPNAQSLSNEANCVVVKRPCYRRYP